MKVLQSFHLLLEEVEQELGREGRVGTWLGGGLAPRSVNLFDILITSLSALQTSPWVCTYTACGSLVWRRSILRRNPMFGRRGGGDEGLDLLLQPHRPISLPVVKLI